MDDLLKQHLHLCESFSTFKSSANINLSNLLNCVNIKNKKYINKQIRENIRNK